MEIAAARCCQRLNDSGLQLRRFRHHCTWVSGISSREFHPRVMPYFCLAPMLPANQAALLPRLPTRLVDLFRLYWLGVLLLLVARLKSP